jgi:FAD/FMN-containing dehydrogenase
MAGKQSILDKLGLFASQHPTIPCLNPSSPTFDLVRSIYAHPEITPLAIIRPTSIDDVSAAVSFLSTNNIPFTIRSGGHDMHGRSMRNDAVALDMRLLNSVRIHSVAESEENEREEGKDVSTATVGGGILIGDLIAALQVEGFATPVGSLPTVGYIGWAMYGGYGAYSARFGLGVDQISGAKLVDAQGEVIDADRELLKGIRGAGGAFGVVVELTARIYRVDRVRAVPESNYYNDC